MALVASASMTLNNPKPDGRKNRLGRFEIVVRHQEEATADPEIKKVASAWHVRWRADGNLRMVSSTEVLTSKRNAERAIEAHAGVSHVHQVGGKFWAVLVDGSRREIRIIDER